ncbi:MAG TPA: hypothetical protein VIC87_00760, partial [Vicinamibacteria bacterium]
MERPAPERVVTQTPFSTAPVDALTPPAVGLTSPVAFVPPLLITPFVAHEGQFTWGPDLFEGGASPFTIGDKAVWRQLFDPAQGTPLEYTASPAFIDHMTGALEAASARQDEFRT